MHFVQPARVWKSGFDHCQPICRLVTARASDRPHGNYISSMSNSAHLKKKLATITDVLCISYFSFILKHVKQGSKRVKDLRSRALSDLKRLLNRATNLIKRGKSGSMLSKTTSRTHLSS